MPPSQNERQFEIKGHLAAVLWFTGLSGSGKTTLARLVEKQLIANYRAHTILLDGDNIRQGLNKDLGFSDADRSENIRRIAEVSRLMSQAGLISLVSFISPFRSDRANARQIIQPFPFIEIYIKCPLEICEQRDPKGLYQRVRKGEIRQFTGFESFYEEPEHPELILETAVEPVAQCADRIIAYLAQLSILVERR
jgi:adenylyl-sulfate kinase